MMHSFEYMATFGNGNIVFEEIYWSCHESIHRDLMVVLASDSDTVRTFVGDGYDDAVGQVHRFDNFPRSVSGDLSQSYG